MLSIILPSWKAAKILQNQLPNFILFLKEKNIDFEIIIVDDGSNDNGETEKVAVKNKCIYLENKINKGKGASVRKGVLAAKGNYICYTDVDIPFDYESYITFYENIKNVDITVGDRTLPDSKYFTEISFKRKLGSDIFSAIVSKLFTAGLHDTQCGLKAFKREIAMDLFSVAHINRFAFDVELISIAVKRNYKIKRLPVIFRCNESQSVKVILHGFGMLIDLTRILFYHLIGKYNKKS